MVNVNAPLLFNLSNSTLCQTHTQQQQQQQQMRLDCFRAHGGLLQPSFDTEMARRQVLNVRIVLAGSALARGQPIMHNAAAPSSEHQQQRQVISDGAEPEGCAGGESGSAALACFCSTCFSCLSLSLARVRLPVIVRRRQCRDLQHHSMPQMCSSSEVLAFNRLLFHPACRDRRLQQLALV
ncbi:hypothetical protein EI94DRAFT_711930 [Lactarius quietus]|nr:hypothetical protein EI94DRAFT_711930 [Lactarius quietus]